MSVPVCKAELVLPCACDGYPPHVQWQDKHFGKDMRRHLPHKLVDGQWVYKCDVCGKERAEGG